MRTHEPASCLLVGRYLSMSFILRVGRLTSCAVWAILPEEAEVSERGKPGLMRGLTDSARCATLRIWGEGGPRDVVLVPSSDVSISGE